MQQNGVDGYIIELACWGQTWNRQMVHHVGRQYNWLLRQCRKRGLALFVSVVNDNMGHRKYGDTGPLLEDVEDMAHKLVRIVRKGGPRGVYVQPVAETQTDAGKRLEQYCILVLSGYVLIYNGEGGFPGTVPSGFQYRAVHPAHISTDVPVDAVAVSDHGLIIRELAADGTLDGPADSVKLTTWVRRMQEAGVPLIGYYAFQRREPDTVAISLLGQIKRGAVKPVLLGNK